MRYGALTLAVVMGMGPGLAASSGAEYPLAGSAWHLPDEAIGARLSPILLLSRSDVRTELAITAEQAASAEQAIAELQAQASSVRGRTGPDAVAARRAVDQSAQEWIEEHLSTEQRARLDQIDLQWQGASALITRPTITASLELTEDQQRQILDHLSKGAEPGEPPIQAHHRIQRESVSVLTEEQRLRWLAMVGSPFELSTNQATAPIPSGG